MTVICVCGGGGGGEWQVGCSCVWRRGRGRHDRFLFDIVLRLNMMPFLLP